MRFIPLCRVTSGGQILKSSQILFKDGMTIYNNKHKLERDFDRL